MRTLLINLLAMKSLALPHFFRREKNNLAVVVFYPSRPVAATFPRVFPRPSPPHFPWGVKNF